VSRLAELNEGSKEQLDRIEAQLAEILRQRTIKDHNRTEEAAALLGKAEFTGTDQLDLLLQRLDRIEAALTDLVEQRMVKDLYSTSEVAKVLGRAEYTVREWCRQGRIRATKKPCGRGKGGEWLVSHEELTRLRNEGLLPFQRPA
jgi:excisionase family DNA binding protein